MKRSDAIKKLIPYVLSPFERTEKENYKCKITEQRAVELMDFIEKQLKMLPPKVRIKKTGSGCLCTLREGCPECDSFIKYYENEWNEE